MIELSWDISIQNHRSYPYACMLSRLVMSRKASVSVNEDKYDDENSDSVAFPSLCALSRN